MFNMMGEDPPILVLNINRLQDGRLKDTAANFVDTTAWRVNLRDYHPVGRFGASHYVKTGDRFAIDGKDNETLSTPFDEI